MTVAAHALSQSPPYAPSRTVNRLEDCFFYHTMDLPGHGTIQGIWDIRNDVDPYLGFVPLKGKRVLELGTASGFLCYEMEKRGADVVGYDLNESLDWDIVPYYDFPQTSHAFERKRHIRELNNGWWYAHAGNKSKAHVVYGDIYKVPESIGPVDIATFGCILLHLRDPFQALASASKLVKETIIVTQHVQEWRGSRDEENRKSLKAPPRRLRGHLLQLVHYLLGDKDWWKREELYPRSQASDCPWAEFIPNPKTGQPNDTWWYLGPTILKQMLGVLGFHRMEIHWHSCDNNGKPQRMFTLVGHRS
jgi:SAM-dependent methyltransferase